MNLDAVLARLLYRWPVQTAATLILVVVLIGITSGVVPPFWRGQVTLAITTAPDATLEVDGKLWPHAVYAGTHQITATTPDGRVSWSKVTLAAGETLTMTLSTGLRAEANPVPAAAPGMRIEQVYFADGAWRVQSVADLPPVEDTGAGVKALTLPVKQQTVAVRRSGTERLATIDTYSGLADQRSADGRTQEVLFQARVGGYGGPGGTLVLRGWSPVEATIPVSHPVTLVRLAPDGSGVLFGEQVGTGEQLSYLSIATRRPEPAVAVPGRITRIDWHPDSKAALITSMDDTRLTLTLLRVQPTIAAAVIMEQVMPGSRDARVPVTWDSDAAYWIASDAQGAGTLWRATLGSLLPERQRNLTAAAISMLPDGTLRTAVLDGTHIIIGREHDGRYMGEAVVTTIQASSDVVGRWQGDVLLLEGTQQAWLITTSSGAVARQ